MSRWFYTQQWLRPDTDYVPPRPPPTPAERCVFPECQERGIVLINYQLYCKTHAKYLGFYTPRITLPQK